MKIKNSIKIRAVGGYLAIILAQTYIAKAAPGDITTVAGNGTSGGPVYGIDALISPAGSARWIAIDPEGNFYISTSSLQIGRVDKETGILSHYAVSGLGGDEGDGGPAIDAKFGGTAGIALDPHGNLFIVDHVNHRIRKVDASTGLISAVAGVGTPGFSGDNGPATAAELDKPSFLTIDKNGNIYFSDSDGGRIRRIDGATGIITTIAGTGTNGFSGDNGQSTSAQVNLVRGMTTDPDGNLYFADSANHRIRRIDISTGIITPYAGRGAGAVTENENALLANLYYPFDICFDGEGNMYISDHSHFCIRRVDAETHLITTVAGTTVSDYSGDGGPATEAAIKGAYTLEMDQAGNLFLTDYLNYRVRMIENIGAPIPQVEDPDVIPGTDPVSSPVVSPVDRAIMLRKMKKLKKKLKKAKRAGSASTVRKLKKQIKNLKKQM